MLLAADSGDVVGDAELLWLPRLSDVPPEQLRKISKLAASFSTTVLEQIADLKDRRIRVWLPDKPDGLIQISLQDENYERLKSSLTPSVEFDEFVDRLMATFWQSIDSCLRGVQIYIMGEFRRTIDATFETFERGLRSISLCGANISELSDSVARARAAFSHSLERIASWFVRGGILPREPFDFERAVQVSTLITNNCYPRFPLKPVVRASHSFHIVGEYLNPVVDVLTNCLQNVVQHSGFTEGAAAVSIIVESTDKSGLDVYIENSVAEYIDLATVIGEMQGLIAENDAVSQRTVALEGRTGIRKMKRIIKHDLRSQGTLTCGRGQGALLWIKFSLPPGAVRAHIYH